MAGQLSVDERRMLARKTRTATLQAVRNLGGRAHRRDIADEALRVGGFTGAELAAPPPPRADRQYTRLVDYQLSWALTKLKGDGLLENPERGVWALAGAATEEPTPIAAPVLSSRLDELRAMPYKDYLRTPEWRETRAAALVRANHACALDAGHTGALEVHHNRYDRLGEEQPGDLTVLCEPCHDLHHAANGRPRRPTAAPKPSVAPPATPASAGQPGPPKPRPRLLRRVFART